MSAHHHSTIKAQLLNCARNHATTVSRIQTAANDPTIFALLLQEPWCNKKGLPPEHSSFYTHYPTPDEPKCITYIRRSNDISAHISFSQSNCFIGSAFIIGQLRFTLYNYYAPPRSRAHLDPLPLLSPDTSSILMGDLNAHHPWWMGAQAIDTDTIRVSSRELDALVDWLETNHFQLLNKPGRPTHFPRNRQKPSTIDLGLVRGPISTQVLTWAVDDNSTSDHSLCTISIPSHTPLTRALRRNWRTANWELFEQTILNANLELHNLTTNQEIENAASTVTSTIMTALNAAAPLRPVTARNAPWWTPNLEYIKQRLQQAERRLRTDPNPTNSEQCVQLRKRWKHLTHNARIRYRTHQLTKTDSKSVWKVIKNHHTHHKPIPPLNGITSFDNKCELLRQTLFPHNLTDTQPLPPDFVTASHDLSNNFAEVTTTEVDTFLQKVNNASSPGHDGISYPIIKRIHAIKPHLLPQLYTAILQQGSHPAEWKTANCVVIPKPNKASYNDPKSYRPISLLPCLSKGMAHIAAKRIAAAAVRTGGIHHTQMGSRAQYSAIHALLHTIDPASRSLTTPTNATNGKAPRSTILTHDIEGAFNNVQRSTLIEIMRQRRLPLYLIQWARSFTTNRRLGFAFDNKTEAHQPYNCGLPQGSPTSPILFLIYAQAMLETNQRSASSTLTSYVDDVAMVQTSRSLLNNTRTLEERTILQLQRGSHLGLTYSPNKSDLLFLLPPTSDHRTRPLTINPTVKFNDTTVQPSRSITYLGVIIDESLTFKPHANKAASKGHQAIGSLNFLHHRQWSVPATVLHHLTFTAVLPKILWASPVWWTGTQAVLSPLQTAYHSIARWITGLPPSTAIANLLQAANLSPLALYLDFLSTKESIRQAFSPTPIMPTTTSPQNIPGSQRLLSFLQCLGPGKLEDRITTSPHNIPRGPKPHTTKLNNQAATHTNWIRSLLDHTILIYTDGSKLDNGNTGSGWCIMQTLHGTTTTMFEGHCHLGTQSEVFDAKLHAAYEALQAINTLPPASAHLCIDNSSAIDSLNNNTYNHHHARHAIEAATELITTGWTISTVWVPSHTGITGNKRADIQAKAGASNNRLLCQHSVTTKTWLLAEAKRKFMSEWHTTHKSAKPSLTWPQHLSELKWKETQALFRVFARRAPTDIDPITKTAPTTCACNASPPTSEHILAECPLFDRQRTELLYRLKTPTITRDQVLLPTHTKPVLDFLKATGLGFHTRLNYTKQNDSAQATQEKEEESGEETGGSESEMDEFE
jgi:ribonuclease HI